jgi:hypothetical protein
MIEPVFIIFPVKDVKKKKHYIWQYCVSTVLIRSVTSLSMMMAAETIAEMLFSVKWLIAWEDFIAFSY